MLIGDASHVREKRGVTRDLDIELGENDMRVIAGVVRHDVRCTR